MASRMTWWRTNRRLGGWLALTALVLQFALSFGHIHGEDFAAAGRSSPVVATSTNSNPGPWHPGDHDGCAICATVHMLGSLVAAVPPALPQPTAFILARHDIPTAGLVTTLRDDLAKARAPPV
jgi:hypothetical protein